MDEVGVEAAGSVLAGLQVAGGLAGEQLALSRNEQDPRCRGTQHTPNKKTQLK